MQKQPCSFLHESLPLFVKDATFSRRVSGLSVRNSNPPASAGGCLVFADASALFSIYLLADALTGIFNGSHTKAEVEGLIKAWMRLAKESMG